MPLINDMFPSKYVSGNDLKGKAVVLTIQGVRQEEMFDVQSQKKTRKWVLYFKDAKKGVLLGKTQATEIAEAVGSQDTGEWTGSKIEIFPKTVRAFGKNWNAVRFRKPTGKAIEQTPSALQVEVEEEPEDIEGAEEFDPDTGEILSKAEHKDETPMWDIMESELQEMERMPIGNDLKTFREKWASKYTDLTAQQQGMLKSRIAKIEKAIKESGLAPDGLPFPMGEAKQ